MPAVTFKDLPEGARFIFAPSSDGFFKDHNVYVKLSDRAYRKLGREDRFRIGSIKAKVERQSP